MDPARFRAPEAGRIIKVPTGYVAFVPAPLPPKLVYDPDLVLALSRADASLGELSAMGRQLPNPHLLIAPYLRREAVSSSRIEGTRTTLPELLMEEMGAAGSEERQEDVREVRNYVIALEFGLRRLRDLPLSLRLVREIHARLMKGVRGDRATPGEFRRSQNWVGAPGSTPATAEYVPPPPTEMMEALHSWERFLHERDVIPDLMACGLMHEQFEAIHPFLDGNGRVGRLLITLFLIERGRLSQPLLYLSDFIESRRDEYYRYLQAVRTHGDWNGWLRYFLEGVAWTSQKALQQARELTDLRERLRGRLSAKANALRVVDELFVNPYITVARAEKLLKVSNPTARQIVRVLEAEGMLHEVSGRAWGRLYVSRPILDAIQAPGD